MDAGGFGMDDAESVDESVDENVHYGGQMDISLLNDFREYCEHAEKNFVPLTKTQKTAINLLLTLQETKASLKTYESIMEWHLKSNGNLQPHESFKNSKKYLSKEKLYKDLSRAIENCLNVKYKNYVESYTK